MVVLMGRAPLRWRRGWTGCSAACAPLRDRLCCLPTACCGCWQVRWLELPTSEGRRFLLDTARLKRLSHYEGVPALGCWNAHTPG